jgi:ADP-ribose pyrophosphatase
MSHKLIRTETLYKGRIFDLRRDEVQLPNGRSVTLDVIHHPGAVVILPLDHQGNIYFINQYRHAAGVQLLELPAGTLEPGEAPYNTAEREIREETGFSAGALEPIGDIYLAPGYSSEHLVIFLATDLTSDPLPGDEDEFLAVQKLAVKEAYHRAETGQIQDAKTLASLTLARPWLIRYGHL